MNEAPSSAKKTIRQALVDRPKKTAIKHTDWRKWLISLVAAGCLCAVTLSGFLKMPEMLVYDLLTSLSYPREQANHVVLVEIPTEEWLNPGTSTEALIQVLNELNTFEVLAFNQSLVYANTDQNFWRQQSRVKILPNVYIEPQDGGRIGYRIGTLLSDNEKSEAGYVLPLVPEYGITRSIRSSVKWADENLPAFQLLLAERYVEALLNKPFQWPDGQTVYINFNNGAPVLPRYSASHFSGQKPNNAFMQGKVVLLTTPLTAQEALVSVPHGAFAESVPAHLVHMQALNTLINQAVIVHLGAVYTALLSGLVFFIFLFVFQLQNIRLNSLTMAGSAFITLLVSWFLLSFHYLYVPVLMLITSLLLAYFIAHRFNRTSESDLVAHVQFDLMSRLRAKKTQQSFYRSDDPWRQLIVFISQHLLLERSILLERGGDDHRLKEIKSLGCSLDDIEERRRDYQRFPYSQSLLQELPLNLEGRTYFKNLSPGEQQFLVPLQFAGEVLGFWAFTIKPEADWDQSLFMANITAFSRQISILLHNRNVFEDEQESIQKLSTKLLNFNAQPRKQQALKSAVAGVEHRLNIMEGIFDGMSTAAILYDLFGQVISSNRLMDGLAREAGLAIYETTSLDLMTRVSGLSVNEARSRLRYVVLNMASIDLPLSDLLENRHYLLHVRPIKWEPQEGFTGSDETRPFELLGVLFEFINVTPIQRRFSADRAAYESLFSTLRNDFSSLSMCQLQLSLNAGPPPPAILENMSSALERSTEVIRRAEKLLHDATLTSAKGGKLLHPLLLLKRALNQVKDQAQQAKLKLTSQLPNFTGLVFVGEDELHALLVQSLVLLIEDAVPESSIRIAVHERSAADYPDRQGRIVIALENTGYGMPQKELDAHRVDSSYIKTDAIALFKNAMHGVFLWQVDVAISSEVGKGFHIDISLPVTNFLNTEERI